MLSGLEQEYLKFIDDNSQFLYDMWLNLHCKKDYVFDVESFNKMCYDVFTEEYMNLKKAG